jgi:alkylation response protein AidB-like acyl-CoA dehydrogenase
MPNPFFSKRDLAFQLYEVADVEQLCQYPYYQDHAKETFDMVIDAAESIAETMLRPLLTEMDRQEPQLVDGQIRIHKGMEAIIRKFGEDGWINAMFGYEEGGQQLPITLHNIAGFIFQAANYSASVYPFLTTGAANLLRSFGSQTLINTFTPNMYSGHWQGTMALTEPNAGSSLSDITTTAIPTAETGVYKIEGQKIFISAGDHDAAENHVHLLLARIKDAPLGTKGISLFAVPKKRIVQDALLPNDVTTIGIYHKMGYKGCPIAHLHFGADHNCIGYLVGEPHKGLSYMFQMMNEARIGVGTNAVAIGTAAYYASLQYAKERLQGRPISEKNPANPQTAIINHADVKRMLLFQKAITEGSLALLIYCGYLSDIAHVAEGETKAKAALLVDLLTPIAKSYPSEMCCQTTSAAVQILGGAGYTTDFPVEQYYREARIHPIHEGTTGIHGLDLLGRKVLLHNGKALQYLQEEISETLQKAQKISILQPFVTQLSKSLSVLQQTMQHLLTIAQQDTEVFLADATLFLEMMSIVVIAWQWLRQAIVATSVVATSVAATSVAATSVAATSVVATEGLATGIDKDFYQGKLMATRYYFEYELVKIIALSKRLQSEDKVTVEMKEEWF